jgi:translation initiation factor 2B subunit (eIF-2B alpha/beta/delta family)
MGIASMIPSEQSSTQVIREIREDNVSGASEISRKAASGFVMFAAETDAASQQEYFEGLLRLGTELICAQPHMASVFNLVNTILYSVEELLPLHTVAELAEFTREKAEEFSYNSLNSIQLIAQAGEKLVEDGSQILTFSASGSILAILKKAKEMGKDFGVTVCESRPMLEGRLLARFLGNAKIPVTLIADAAMGIYAREADLFLVGADSVSETSFINKIGTLYLGLLSREYGIPLNMACERSKFISTSWRIAPFASGSPEEISEEQLANVTVENPYFEEIPLSFCKQVITNEGFLSPSQIPNYIRKTRLSQKLMERIRELPFTISPIPKPDDR